MGIYMNGRLNLPAGGVAAAMLVGIGCGGPAAAQMKSNHVLDRLIDDGKIVLDARLRYSFADFGSLSKDANGVTYRLRGGFETGSVHKTKLLMDFEHVRALNDDFNSTTNGNTEFPVVADPDATELNRLQLVNTSVPDTSITAGRQRIIYDDARFVGNVGWRQNEQTFDALRIVNTSVPNLTLDVSYVDQVNRIFGDDSPQGRFESDSYFLNAKYDASTGTMRAEFTGFAYLLDFENPNIAPAARRLSTQTYGGSAAIGRGRFQIRGSFASQTPFGGNANDFDVNYYTVEGALKHNSLTFRGGYEVLGGDGSFGFVTPLSTAHKFNGFADLFLATPADGLEDVYGKIGFAKKGVGPFGLLKGVIAYHSFSGENGGADYGDELDLLFVSKLKTATRLTYLVKYANFQSKDGFAQDVTRLTAEINLSI